MKFIKFLKKIIKPLPQLNNRSNVASEVVRSNYEEALIELHAGRWKAFNKKIADSLKIPNKASGRAFRRIYVLDNVTYAIGHFIFLAAFFVVYKNQIKKNRFLILSDKIANYEIFRSIIKSIKSKNIHFIFCSESCRILRESSFQKINIYCTSFQEKALNYLQFLCLAEIFRKGRPPFDKKYLNKHYVITARKEILKTTKGDKFILFHLRNENNSIRNVNPLTYLPSIQALKESGLQINFVGNVNSSMYELLREMDIHVDRSTNKWDAFLLTHCSHFIGTNSGPWTTSYLHGIPTLITNHIPLTCELSASSAYFLSKKVVDKAGKLISRSEYARLFGMSEQKSLFEQHGYRVIDNTSQELKESILKFVFLQKPAPRNDWRRLRAQLLRQPYSSGYGLNLARNIDNVF